MPQTFNLIPLKTPVDTNGGACNPEWRSFFVNAANGVNSIGNSGTTAQRPTQGVYLGFLYFDTTLGKLIFCRQVSPTVAWAQITSTNI
jgi:hypothetical protein